MKRNDFHCNFSTSFPRALIAVAFLATPIAQTGCATAGVSTVAKFWHLKHRRGRGMYSLTEQELHASFTFTRRVHESNARLKTFVGFENPPTFLVMWYRSITSWSLSFSWISKSLCCDGISILSRLWMLGTCDHRSWTLCCWGSSGKKTLSLCSVLATSTTFLFRLWRTS
jgi:hypothetical protein